MKIDYKIIAILALFLYIIVGQNICNNPAVDTRDTISSITTYDTITEYEYNYIKKDTTIYNIKYENITINPNTDSATSIVESSTTLEDTLIDIGVRAYSVAPVDSFKITYTPKFPITITKFITKETETVLEEKAKMQVYAGLILSGGRNSFGFAPTLLFKTPREHIVSLGYDLARNEINFGYSIKIKLGKNK
jgi:YbbR domain-containing protein